MNSHGRTWNNRIAKPPLQPRQHLINHLLDQINYLTNHGFVPRIKRTAYKTQAVQLQHAQLKRTAVENLAKLQQQKGTLADLKSSLQDDKARLLKELELSQRRNLQLKQRSQDCFNQFNLFYRKVSESLVRQNQLQINISKASQGHRLIISQVVLKRNEKMSMQNQIARSQTQAIYLSKILLQLNQTPVTQQLLQLAMKVKCKKQNLQSLELQRANKCDNIQTTEKRGLCIEQKIEKLTFILKSNATEHIQLQKEFADQLQRNKKKEQFINKLGLKDQIIQGELDSVEAEHDRRREELEDVGRKVRQQEERKRAVTFHNQELGEANSSLRKLKAVRILEYSAIAKLTGHIADSGCR